LGEAISASTPEDRIEELADIIEVVSSLALIENKSLDDVIEIATSKREKRGGFQKRIYLEKVE